MTEGPVEQARPWLNLDVGDCSAILVERRPGFELLVLRLVDEVGLPRGMRYLPESSNSVWLIPRIGAVFTAIEPENLFAELKVEFLKAEVEVMPKKLVDAFPYALNCATFDMFFEMKLRDFVSDATSMVHAAIARHPRYGGDVK